ncbi:MAG: ATP-binding protein [Gemmatimonadaceae bacterium]
MMASGFSGRERASLALVGAACIGAALFVRTWSVPYLVSTTLATVSALLLARGARPRGTWISMLALSLAMSAVSWNAWRVLAAATDTGRATPSDESLARLSAASADVIPELQRSASRLVSAPSIAAGSPVTGLEPLLPTAARGEAAAVVLADSLPLAWAGIVRLPLGAMSDSVGVVRGGFYVVAYAKATAGDRTAIAMRTVHAEAPADRLSRSFLSVISRDLEFDRVDVSSTPMDSAVPLHAGSQDVLWLRPALSSSGAVRLRLEERSRVVVLGLLAAVIFVGMALVWRHTTGLTGRLATLGVALSIVGVAPLNSLSNVARVFNPGYYYSAAGGPWTASAGALAMTGALACLAVFAFVRKRGWRPPAWATIPVALLCVSLGPFLVRHLARGLTLPPRGAPPTLWIAWEVALFLAAAGTLLCGVWAAGVSRRGGFLRHGAVLGSAVAAIAAFLAPVVWQSPGRFPEWYVLLWIAATAAVVFARRSRGLTLHVAFVAACGASTLVWGSVTRKRVELAERDVAGLAVADPEIEGLLERLMFRVREESAPRTTADLLRLYVQSELAAAGNPVELAVWPPRRVAEEPDAELVIADLRRRAEGERAVVHEADSLDVPVLRQFGSSQGVQLVLAAPLDSGRTFTAVVAPRSQLIAEDPFAALLGLDVPTAVEPPYRLSVSAGDAIRPISKEEWVRRGDELHGDWLLEAVLGNLHAHVEVELRALDALFARGTLLITLNLVIFGALWLLAALSDRAMLRWLRGRVSRWRSSYRARLTLALFGAFALPAVAFAIWTLNRLRSEDVVSRSLLVQETLRAVRVRNELDLRSEADRLQAPLFWYRNGVLTGVSDPLYAELAPIGQFLDPVAGEDVLFGLEETTNRRISVGAVPTLLGYRVLGDGSVLAAPARRSELTLERQQRDVLALLVVSMVVGTLIALWLSGLAARMFASPIAALRRAASDVAGGARDLPSLGREPLSEFRPVYGTFRRMAVDLSDSRLALDAARRRTEAVLRDVATGVIALDLQARVVLANPQAERILGVGLAAGESLHRVGDPGVVDRVRAFLDGVDDEDAFALQLRGRQLQVRLTRLSRGDGGAVLTLDDVTDLARAQRVFAWGEMARQVAHEIKNPLTPIRLGVQHVRRAHADARSDFGSILETNVERILEEIDRLDEIARSFARFGLRPGDARGVSSVNVSAVLRDVVELERMGDSGITWEISAPDELHAQTREGELREVMLNVLENARLANATRVTVHAARSDAWASITVDDDGDGIPAELVPRVFEPHFSARTSGSGLGLAITKRLVESWGGRIRIDRRDTRGTRVTIALVAAHG